MGGITPGPIRSSYSLRQNSNAGTRGKASVEGQRLTDIARLHDRQVQAVARRQLRLSLGSLPGNLNLVPTDGEYGGDQGVKHREGVFYCATPVDRQVAVKYLLVHLGACDVVLLGPVSKERLEQLPVRVRSADEIHRDIGVNEDHVHA